jgi:type IV pilus assembly protein PilB
MTPLDAAHAIPEALVRAEGLLGLRWDGDDLVVGVRESLPSDAADDLLRKVRSAEVPTVREQRVPDDELRELIDLVYGNEDVPEALPAVHEDDDGPIAALVNQIIDRAVRMRASDIHVEPQERDALVRVRIDGELEELTRQPSGIAAPVVSRLKVMAQMNIVERRLPQDGQFSVTVGDREIDVRLATVATMYGEKAVMRLLDTRRPAVDIGQLGMHDRSLEDFQHMLRANFGMIIAAGPTGAGKTTTLQCALRDINTPKRNVSTLEDPVEYVVDGINHIPVNDGIGASFATQLRAILRQDPDVILIGEVRDSETAKIGVQAALSGRLVLTSLHAQDAVAAVYRLFQLDVDPHLVAASLRGVVAQRLLRRICRYCGQSYSASVAERILLGAPADSAPLMLRRGVGCALCRGTGYRDRVAAFQVLDVTDELRELIAERASKQRIAEVAAAGGFRAIADEALELARLGQTSVEEAMRLVGVDG